MLKREVEITNKLGLHARASAKLTQTASTYACEVWLARSNRRINAKSIMGVMMLAAAKGVTITVETDGAGRRGGDAGHSRPDRRQIRGRRVNR